MNRLINTEQYAQLCFAQQARECEEKKNAWLKLAALAVAGLIHVVILIQFGNDLKPAAAKPQRVSLLEVELVATAVASEMPKKIVQEPISPKVEPVPEPLPEPLPEPEKAEPESLPQLKKPEPEVVKKRPAKKIKSKRHKVVQPKAVAVKKEIIDTKPVEPRPPLHRPIALTQVVQAATDTQTMADKERRIKLRQQYLVRIMALVEAHKSYPLSARRRHIEGEIQLSFQVNAEGYVSDIQITGKSSVLRRASMDALQNSLPLPPPPKEILEASHSRFIMQYQLER